VAGYYVSSAANFVEDAPDRIVGLLSQALIEHFSGDHDRQLYSWRQQVQLLQDEFRKFLPGRTPARDWGLIIEYPLLRLQKRLDVVILAGEVICILEFKVGAQTLAEADRRQVEDYALSLRDFHTSSRDATIYPVLCATASSKTNLAPIEKGTVGQVGAIGSDGLCLLFAQLAAFQSQQASTQIDYQAWDRGAYRPVPTIIEAAEALYAGHSVGDIAQAGAEAQNLGATTEALISLIQRAKREGEHLVIFVTGVPGAGKTLVGLNAVHDPRFRDEGHTFGAYLSGNTPLVRVLREALAEDEHRRRGTKKSEARRRVQSAIQTLMDFLREYLKAHDGEAPDDHVIIFDEAQRAWDAAYGAQKFNRSKSEAGLFLEIMGRHDDWAVIIALVGGGQEINKGELGISEWGRALQAERDRDGARAWKAIASPQVLAGDEVTAWQSLFDSEVPAWVEADARLHLSTSIRSYGSDAAPKWVNSLLASDLQSAASIARSEADFPVYLTRDLETARAWLVQHSRGNRRSGLVASSGARRLRAEGLGASIGAAELDAVAHWFLRPRGDIRSSFALEVTANEYACQGLELDYVGVCWDGDLAFDFSHAKWRPRRLNGTRWQTVQGDDGRNWILNKYRVLLTRARLGMVIWVPRGSSADETRLPKVYDTIAGVLIASGARSLD